MARRKAERLSFFGSRNRVFSSPSTPDGWSPEWKEGQDELDKSPVLSSALFRTKWKRSQNPRVNARQLKALKEMQISCERVQRESIANKSFKKQSYYFLRVTVENDYIVTAWRSQQDFVDLDTKIRVEKPTSDMPLKIPADTFRNSQDANKTKAARIENYIKCILASPELIPYLVIFLSVALEKLKASKIRHSVSSRKALPSGRIKSCPATPAGTGEMDIFGMDFLEALNDINPTEVEETPEKIGDDDETKPLLNFLPGLSLSSSKFKTQVVEYDELKSYDVTSSPSHDSQSPSSPEASPIGSARSLGVHSGIGHHRGIDSHNSTSPHGSPSSHDRPNSHSLGLHNRVITKPIKRTRTQLDYERSAPLTPVTFLNCPLCLQMYDSYPNCTPILLYCGHTHCKHCLKSLYKDKKLKCSKCHQLTLTNSIEELPYNQVLQDLVKAVQAKQASHCVQCERGTPSVYCEYCDATLCKKCNVDLHKLKALKRHQPVPLDNQDELNQYCELHSEPLNFYCVECSILICQFCRIPGNTHSKHEINTIAAVEDLCKETLQNSKWDIRQSKQHMEQLNTELFRFEEDLMSQTSQAETEIKELFNELMDGLERRKAEVLKELKQQTEDSRRNLNEKREQMAISLGGLETLLEETSRTSELQKNELVSSSAKLTSKILKITSTARQLQDNTYSSVALKFYAEQDLMSQIERYGMIEVGVGKCTNPIVSAGPQITGASEVKPSSLVLSWMAVENVSGYIIEMRYADESKLDDWRVVGRTSRNYQRISSLRQNTAYLFRIGAQSKDKKTMIWGNVRTFTSAKREESDARIQVYQTRTELISADRTIPTDITPDAQGEVPPSFDGCNCRGRRTCDMCRDTQNVNARSRSVPASRRKPPPQIKKRPTRALSPPTRPTKPPRQTRNSARTAYPRQTKSPPARPSPRKPKPFVSAPNSAHSGNQVRIIPKLETIISAGNPNRARGRPGRSSSVDRHRGPPPKPKYDIGGIGAVAIFPVVSPARRQHVRDSRKGRPKASVTRASSASPVSRKGYSRDSYRGHY